MQKVTRVSAPRLPLSAYQELSVFKLFGVDVGLLGAMADLPVDAVLDGDRAFTEFKGALTEQFAAQELLASTGASQHYWSSGSGGAEVDFVVQTPGGVVPVEVKATRNRKSQSLRVYRDKFHPVAAVRASLEPFIRTEHLIDLPLYALPALTAEVADAALAGS